MTNGTNAFRVITADPPWLFGDKLPGDSRGASKQYSCLSIDDIRAFPLPPLLDDAILFLWRVSSMPQEALSVVRAWGFVPKSEIVWEKLTKKGKPWIGMGHYVRAAHETCILAIRGRFKVRDRSIRSRFAAKVPVGADGKYIHSGKPEEFRELVERLCEGLYVELFGRKLRDGWTVLGNQVPDSSPDARTACTALAASIPVPALEGRPAAFDQHLIERLED